MERQSLDKDTDLTLRTFLGAQGMKKGDLSKFIEEAVRRRVLQCTIQDIMARNAGTPPRVTRFPDPTDDFLLALSEAGMADYLVTGDKSGLLALGHHRGTQIVSARDFAALFA